MPFPAQRHPGATARFPPGLGAPSNKISGLDTMSNRPQHPGVPVEPLSPLEARRLIRRILQEGSVTFSGHAQREMNKDGLTMVDVTNVLRGGVVDPAENENGSWRYRVRTARIAVVVALRGAAELRVVTAWRSHP
jgi:hypothetical protein